MLNTIFVTLFCTQYYGNYWFEGATHSYEIESLPNKQYSVTVYDGTNIVSTYTTTKLWGIK